MGNRLRWDKLHDLRKTRNGAVPLTSLSKGKKRRKKKKFKVARYRELKSPTFEVGEPRVRKP